MNSMLVAAVALVSVLFSCASSHAADFFGATVTTRETTTSSWKAGVRGVRPIVETVPVTSPAAQYGLRQADVILSVNGESVRDTAELKRFTADTLSVLVLRGSARMILTIDRKAIEKEKEEKEAEKKKRESAAQPKAESPVQEDANGGQTENGNSQPVIFNDQTLFQRANPTNPNEPVSDDGKAGKSRKQKKPESGADSPDP